MNYAKYKIIGQDGKERPNKRGLSGGRMSTREIPSLFETGRPRDREPRYAAQRSTQNLEKKGSIPWAAQRASTVLTYLQSLECA